MTFRSDHEREIYDAEYATCGAQTIGGREQFAEHAVMLDRKLRGNFKQPHHGGPGFVGKGHYKRTRKVVKNGPAMYEQAHVEACRRYNCPPLKWTNGERLDCQYSAKMFITAALVPILGRQNTADASGVDVTTLDHWRRRAGSLPGEARAGEEYGKTLVVEWETVEMSFVRRRRAA